MDDGCERYFRHCISPAGEKAKLPRHRPKRRNRLDDRRQQIFPRKMSVEIGENQSAHFQPRFMGRSADMRCENHRFPPQIITRGVWLYFYRLVWRILTCPFENENGGCRDFDRSFQRSEISSSPHKKTISPPPHPSNQRNGTVESRDLRKCLTLQTNAFLQH